MASQAAGSLGRRITEFFTGWLSVPARETLFLKFFSFRHVRMLGFISPRVTEVSDERCVIKIPLNRRTRNHLHSMYFGVLAAGADCAGGLVAMRMIHQEGNRAALIFKDFKAEFLKRAEGDVFFTCTQGPEIREMVRKALQSGERENMPVSIVATVPSKLGDEPVAKFTLTLSIKRR